MNTKTLITSLSGIALAMSFSLAQAETSEIEIVNLDIELSILAELDQQDVHIIEQEEMQATVGTRRGRGQGRREVSRSSYR
ncbi:MAG: hypothetical protein QM487_12765 [Candidatus Marithrix sp.]